MKKEPIILFRKDFQTEEELDIAKKHFPCVESRVGLENNLVVARYSALPFYNELERDLKLQSSELINSYYQHQYIANFDYYEDLKDIVIGKDSNGKNIFLTPRTYYDLQSVPKDGGPFVLKGRTNSRKNQWDSKMFAKDYKEAVDIYCDLSIDPMIGHQGVLVREYVPLKTFEIGINGQPFANEWRFFFYKAEILSVGYYWTGCSHIPELKDLPKEAYDCARQTAEIIKDNVNFFVIDVAETQSGYWIVIEVNDGQMSGLSGNKAEVLYSNLSRLLK